MNWKVFLLVFLMLLVALPLQAQSFDECTDFDVTDYERVVEVCTELLENDPLNVDAYFSRAYAQTELGNYEESIVDYTKVLLLQPKYAYAYNNRGYAYGRLGELEAAIADFSRAIIVDPDYVQPRLNRAYTYIDLGEYENALADADLLADIAPNNVYAYDIRGFVYLEQEDYEAAVDTYTTYIELAPDDPSGYLSRGYAYWLLDEDERAAPDYMVWVEANAPRTSRIDPDDALEPFTITLEAGIHYTLAIEAVAGDILTASAVARDETIDPVLILLDGNGNPITVDDDGAGGIADVDAIIEDFEIPEDGDYTLVIGYAGGGSEGDVRLDVRLNSVR